MPVWFSITQMGKDVSFLPAGYLLLKLRNLKKDPAHQNPPSFLALALLIQFTFQVMHPLVKFCLSPQMKFVVGLTHISNKEKYLSA